MDRTLGPSCCVCGATDARALVDVTLTDGAGVTLCGTHALMHDRAPSRARNLLELRALLRDRRGRRDRRQDADELGAQLTAAFASGQRGADRRRA